MKTPTPIKNLVQSVLLLLTLASVQMVNAATTNVINFSTTTVPANAGPNNPANGATVFSGAGLAIGDVVVFDGVVANNTGATGDNWGAVNLNQGGFRGVTTAAFGVLVRTGVSSPANACSIFVNGTGGPNVPNTSEVQTNRVRIELTATAAGSTTNMNYFMEIDQGVTGTWTGNLSGSGVTFNGNTIALTFGSQNCAEFFAQYAPISLGAPTPATNTVALGQTATFTAAINGFPLNTAQQWRSNGVAIAGATGFTYTTPPVTAGYNGAQYSIVVTNLNNTANVVTSSVATLFVRSTPGIVTFNFPTTTTIAGYGPVTDPGVSISGAGLLAGDTVVFDGILTPNGAQPSDAWTAINIAGAGYGNVTSAQLGVLDRQGAGPSQLFINGGGASNPTSGGAATNRLRIELYPSANGSTTNMGWLVEIDQNLTGTFQPAITGTNLTFPNNQLPLTFGSSGGSAFVFQNPQSPVSIFSGPSPSSQVVAVGSPATVGVTVQGWSPAFQWRKNGATIANATNRTYTLPSAALGDNGAQFTVVVSNRLNSANVVTSSVATVSVLIPNNLTWYPIIDFTTWDTATANWTTNGGVSQTKFVTGNNVTFDSQGYNAGGSAITTTNDVNLNAATVNVTGGQVYSLAGTGNVGGQSLLLTGDGTGALGLQSSAAFTSANIDTGSTLDVGYNGISGSISASFITNNGTIDFQNASGVLTISGVITGSGSIIQDGAGSTILSSPSSAYTIGAINSGVLIIASTPNPGDIPNNSELQPNSSASLLFIPNAVTGAGHYAFTGFQTTLLTGLSSFTGQNRLQWSHVIVDNPQALGDAISGASAVTGADNVGGLYLSNNIVWSQPLTLNPRQPAPAASGTAPHLANLSGTNDVTSPLSFNNGQGGSEINVEATAGQLTIDSALGNNTSGTNNLNLQGAATGIWNGVLVDGTAPLNIVVRGSGKWLLNGANTYSGTTTVSSGSLGGTGVISGPVTAAAGGTLAPGFGGIGALTINNNLTLSSGSFTSMKLNKTASTNDQIVGVNNLTYGGTLLVTNLSGTLTTSDSFQLFSAASYSGAFASVSPATPGTGLAWNVSTLATDGTLRIAVNTIATNPTNITAMVLGGTNLQLSWPTDHTGWTLQVQTNSLSVGLGTNWVPVANSITTNKVIVPIVIGNPSVFYRLKN